MKGFWDATMSFCSALCIFFFFDNQPYNPTLPTPTTQTWVQEPLKPLRLGEVPTHLMWAVVLYACFSIRMDGGFTTSNNNVTRQLIANKRLKLAASNWVSLISQPFSQFCHNLSTWQLVSGGNMDPPLTTHNIGKLWQ